MTTVTGDHATEFEVHKFSAFASDLGLRPGRWPEVLETSLGNGQAFVIRHAELRDGDLAWVDYAQRLGCISLRVFND